MIAAGAVQRLGGFLIDSAKAAAEDEAATMRLEQALRNAGGSFDENLEKVNARIDAGQKLAFSDDDVRDSFQKLLAATGDTDEALKRQALAMDLARGAGIPLSQASTLLGKVTAENVEVFKRMGITIGEGASEAEAFAAIQAKFGGQADAYAKSTAGQFEQAKIRMGELKEQLGAVLLPAFTAFATFMVNVALPAIEDFANRAGPKIKEFAQDVKAYWESDIKPALDALVAAYEKLEPVIRPILETIGRHIENVGRVLKDTVSLILAVISGDWGRAWDLAKQLVEDVIQLLKGDIEGIVDIIQGALPLIGEAARNIGSSIKDSIWAGLGDLWALGADIIHWILQGLKDMAWQIGDWAKSALDPRKWDIPGLSPLLDAYQHAGEIAGGNLGEGMRLQIAAKSTEIEQAAADITRKVRDLALKAEADAAKLPGGAAVTPVSSPGGMGNPSVNYVDPRGTNLTANDIYAWHEAPDFGFVGARPVVVNIQNAHMTDQASANRTLTNALRAAGVA